MALKKHSKQIRTQTQIFRNAYALSQGTKLVHLLQKMHKNYRVLIG